MSFDDFILANENIFYEIFPENKEFFEDFKSIAYTEGCWISANFLYKYGIQKSTNKNSQYKKQKNFSVKNGDYKIVDVNKKLNNQSCIKTDYYLSPDCFKQQCMESKYKDSKNIIKYYLNMEKLCTSYSEYEFGYTHDNLFQDLMNDININNSDMIDVNNKQIINITGGRKTKKVD